MKQCSITNCDNPVSPRSRFHTCSRCRASIRSWMKRRAAEIVARKQNLEKYMTRMRAVK